jgi:tellurite resistance protein
MEIAGFLLALKRRLTIDEPGDPIAAARVFLTVHGDTAEAEALRRVIVAVATGCGDFHESEQWLFSQRTTAIAAALVDARLDGVYTEEEWQRACSF